MHLWSDYEGKTIADAYPLGQLIRPEGRSAFFATSNGTGVPAVIRLTESLNDEAEMIERWRQIAEMKQEHLVTIRKYGRTKFESTPLAYALMEPSDGSLAEILRERPLTPIETREVANSLIDALKALHENGLVHGMIEPSNVMAVGEVVKLRSDCVRECRLDFEFLTPEECVALKERDVDMLSTLLLQALTLEKVPNPAIKLPAPFDRIVTKGLDHSWGLAEIDSALNPPVVKPLVPPGVLSASRIPAVAGAATVPAGAAVAGGVTEPVAAVKPRGPLVPPGTLNPTAAGTFNATPSDTVNPTPAGTLNPTPSGPALHVRRVENEILPAGNAKSLWIAGVAVLIVLALIGWRALGGKASPKPVASAAPVVSQSAPAAGVPAGAKPAAAAPVARPVVEARPVAESGHAPVATSETQAGWHVIVFTYNHQDQAFAKVASIRARHSGLSPEVFAPSGRAPYLVALGGAMSEREADGLKNRAKRDGMPRDTFIRRYGAR